MRSSPSNGSTRSRASATTRPAIAPTVRHAIRINSTTAVVDVCVTSHATGSSKSRVCPAPTNPLVIAARTPLTDPAPQHRTLAEPARHHHRGVALVDLDTLYDYSAVDVDRSRP